MGIDPGLASTGWGVLEERHSKRGEKLFCVEYGTIETKADIPRAERLCFILKQMRLIIKKYKPSLAAIENLYFGKNVSSAIPVAEGRGVISAAIAEQGIPLLEFTPGAIKLGVSGAARAGKKQVQEMVRIILELEEQPKPDHAADALAAAICAANVKEFV